MGYGITHTAEMPVVGATAGSEWAELLVDVLDELRTTLNAKVTPAGIDINANLSFRSGSNYYAATNLKYLELYLQSGLLDAGTYPGVVYKYAGNLYYNNDSGTQIAITSGAGVAGTVGSINTTGSPAYSASGVEVLWNATDTAYEMRSGSGTNDLADIKVDDVYLNDGSANNLRLTAQAMASDYDFVFPAAVPASNNIVLTASVSGSTATVAFSQTPTVTSITTTGAATIGTSATVGTTLGVTGLTTVTTLKATGAVDFDSTLNVDDECTFGDDVTLGVNKSITLSGTGLVKHGNYTLTIPASAFICTTAVTSADSARTFTSFEIGFAGTLVAPVLLPAGVRIRSIVFNARHGSSSSARRYSLYEDTTEMDFDTDSTASNSSLTVTVASTDYTIVSGTQVQLRIATQNGLSATSDDGINYATITYDQP